jgi:putative DNA primase/helicase
LTRERPREAGARPTPMTVPAGADVTGANGHPARCLSEHHRQALVDSAIDEGVIVERGYYTAERKSELELLGFGRTLQIVPTLVIPVHGVVAGQPPWYMHRPDVTPVKDGRPRKYLIPQGQRMALDVHPRVRAGLGDPRVPLFVTEGSKKVDALISAGARAVVGLVGVWNWRGRNENGGLTVLPDWQWVALKEGRQVFVVYDSDVALKEPVRAAIDRLGLVLRRMGAQVAFVYLPAASGCEKLGADDYLAQGHSLADLVSLASSQSATVTAPGAVAPSPATFFVVGDDGRRRLVPRQLAEHLRAEAPLAAGGESLFVYRNGAYRADGEAWVRRRVAQMLEDRWKRTYPDEVVTFLRDTSPRLWERPPLERINCRNGILDLNTGQLEPHNPEFLSPVQIGAAYDPSARCPAIEHFIGQVVPSDSFQLLFELVGYLLTPDNRLQVAVMLLGSGANGKTTLLNLITELLGRENVAAVPLHKLDEDRFAAAELYGRLANVFADLDSRALRSSSIFKAITGGDELPAERKFRPGFKFRPYARLLFSANAAPPTSDSSDAFFRRWVIIPFERTFGPGHRDTNLLERLVAPEELSGLLNHALEELPRLRERGQFTSSASTAAAGERFRVDSDSVAGFLAERCDYDRHGRASRPALFAAYRAWCDDNNRRELGSQRFAARLRELVPDYGEVTIRGIVHVDGVRTREETP